MFSCGIAVLLRKRLHILRALSARIDRLLSMRNLLSLILTAAWALWFGATIATFVFAIHLFRVHPGDVASQANSAMFVVFGEYELMLAAVAILAAGMMLVSRPTKPLVVLLAALVFSGAVAMTAGMGLTPRMEILREQGKSHSDEFKRLHGRSMMAMTAQSVLLLLCLPLIQSAMSTRGQGESATQRQEQDSTVAAV
jgi:hypothetical protein